MLGEHPFEVGFEEELLFPKGRFQLKKCGNTSLVLRTTTVASRLRAERSTACS